MKKFRSGLMINLPILLNLLFKPYASQYSLFVAICSFCFYINKNKSCIKVHKHVLSTYKKYIIVCTQFMLVCC